MSNRFDFPDEIGWFNEETGKWDKDEPSLPAFMTSPPPDHDYEPGEVTHPMHTDPDCAICGGRKH